MPPSSFEEVASVIEPSPFAEMFGETEDLFEVRGRQRLTEQLSRAGTRTFSCYWRHRTAMLFCKGLRTVSELQGRLNVEQ